LEPTNESNAASIYDIPYDLSQIYTVNIPTDVTRTKEENTKTSESYGQKIILYMKAFSLGEG
jgi:hypothetical protein